MTDLKGITMFTKRPITVLLFCLAIQIAGAQEEASEMYGSAPESLDYPAARNDLLALQLEELRLLSFENPFPTKDIAAIDPITKEKYEKVIVGPAFKSSSKNYDYYRYVTFYNIQYRDERIYALPVLHEDCHDHVEIFGSYSYTSSYSATVNANISVEGLGLGASFTTNRSFAASRNLRATGGIVADHTPYFKKQDWVGRTFIQTYDSTTGTSEFITKEKKRNPWYAALIYPMSGGVAYPYAFSVRDADWTFFIERQITGKCGTAGFANYR